MTDLPIASDRWPAGSERVPFFLVFVPFLTALIYLIARGGGMAERGVRETQAAQSAAADYIKSVAGSSPSDEIAKAKALLDGGTITAAEYEQLKTRVLAG